MSGRDSDGFLKKFLDKSAIFDIIVISVLVLDAYLLQATANTFGSSGITQFPPESIEVAAAQATAGLILVKVINTLMDMGSGKDRYRR